MCTGGEAPSRSPPLCPTFSKSSLPAFLFLGALVLARVVAAAATSLLAPNQACAGACRRETHRTSKQNQLIRLGPPPFCW